MSVLGSSRLPALNGSLVFTAELKINQPGQAAAWLASRISHFLRTHRTLSQHTALDAMLVDSAVVRYAIWGSGNVRMLLQHWYGPS